jgi:hypothetical protein
MSYKINKTNGVLLLDLIDGKIDINTTDLVLVGKNFSGYGEFINENFVKILENFAAVSPPERPLVGQIWYDEGSSRLKVWNGEQFKPTDTTIVSSIEPALLAGDIWIDSRNQQLFFNDGSATVLAGPIYTKSQGPTGFKVETISDRFGNPKTIAKLIVNSSELAVISREEFQAVSDLPGFGSTIQEGITVSSNRPNFEFRGTATRARQLIDAIGSIFNTEDFLKVNGNNITNGSLHIRNNTGLIVGTDSEFTTRIQPNNVIDRVQKNNALYRLQVNSNNATVDAVTVDTPNKYIGIWNSNPSASLDITGNTNILGNLTVNGTLTATNFSEDFTTDNVPEGFINKYFTSDRFNSFFSAAIVPYLEELADDFIFETTVLDSQDNILATPASTTVQTDLLTVVSPQQLVYFEVGQSVRLYGAAIDNVSLTQIPTINNVTLQGDIAGETAVQYKIAYFDFVSGKISTSSLQTAELLINPSLFNQINNVTISFNRPVSNFGVLVYKKINNGSFLLVDVLGQKQLGTQLSNITYIDYGTFSYTSWSKKNPNTGAYDSLTGTIHFPIEAPSQPKKGWVDTTITEVNTLTNQISVAGQFRFEQSVTISQDDTKKIQDEIDRRSQVGIKFLSLNSRRYIVSKLSLPLNFSLLGKSQRTVLKKLSWASESDNRIITVSSQIALDLEMLSFTIDGNMQNQWLKQDSVDKFANYAVDLKVGSNTVHIDKLRILNVVAGGIAAESSTKLTLTSSTVEDSGMSDLLEYSPLIADDSLDLVVSNNVFKNFTNAIDVSVTDNGVFVGNIVQNTGTGVITFGSKFFVSSPNVLRGPAGEFIPGPDTLNSVFDSVNINLTTGTTFTSDVYKYQENGINFNIANNRAIIDFRIDKLRKIDNLEELYEEVIINATKPIQRIISTELDATNGEFKFSISSSNVDVLLTDFSYSELKKLEVNHVGLVYSALLTEYVPSGNIIGTPTIDGDEYTVTLRNFSNISLGTRVRLLNHGGTPNLDSLAGTIININNTLQGANPPEITVKVKYNQNISAVGTGGEITVENTFVLAKGRIF